jgi:hypothetical protein
MAESADYFQHAFHCRAAFHKAVVIVALFVVVESLKHLGIGVLVSPGRENF